LVAPCKNVPNKRIKSNQVSFHLMLQTSILRAIKVETFTMIIISSQHVSTLDGKDKIGIPCFDTTWKIDLSTRERWIGDCKKMKVSHILVNSFLLFAYNTVSCKLPRYNLPKSRLHESREQWIKNHKCKMYLEVQIAGSIMRPCWRSFSPKSLVTKTHLPLIIYAMTHIVHTNPLRMYLYM
jgi:hypothetical protein